MRTECGDFTSTRKPNFELFNANQFLGLSEQEMSEYTGFHFNELNLFRWTNCGFGARWQYFTVPHRFHLESGNSAGMAPEWHRNPPEWYKIGILDDYEG